MSPTLNRSTSLQHFDYGNAIEMHNGIMFNFYPELPRFQFILTQSLKYFIFIPTQSSARMLLIALYPGSLPTDSLGLVLHALTAEVYTTIYLHCPVTGTKL